MADPGAPPEASFASHHSSISRRFQPTRPSEIATEGGLRLADADAMIAACRDAGVRLGVALQRRSRPFKKCGRPLHETK